MQAANPKNYKDLEAQKQIVLDLYEKGGVAPVSPELFNIFEANIRTPDRRPLLDFFRWAIDRFGETGFVHSLCAKLLRLMGRYDEAWGVLCNGFDKASYELYALSFEQGFYEAYRGDYKAQGRAYAELWKSGQYGHKEITALLGAGCALYYRPPFLDGRDTGKRVLIVSDGGFGDLWQYIRFLPYFEKAGMKLSFATIPNRFDAIDVFIKHYYPDAFHYKLTGRGAPLIDQNNLNERADYMISSGMLAGAIMQDNKDIPPPVPYEPPPEYCQKWQDWIRQRTASLGLDPALPIMGISVGGDRGNENEHVRHVDIEQFYQAFGKKARLILFNNWLSDDDRAWLKAHPDVMFPFAEETNLLDLLALVGEVDLMLGADSFPAHLAACQMKDSWIMLYDPSEWRWGPKRKNYNKYPWYPTARLFRQSAMSEDGHGDWQPVFDNLITAFEEFMDLRAKFPELSQGGLVNSSRLIEMNKAMPLAQIYACLAKRAFLPSYSANNLGSEYWHFRNYHLLQLAILCTGHGFTHMAEIWLAQIATYQGFEKIALLRLMQIWAYYQKHDQIFNLLLRLPDQFPPQVMGPSQKLVDEVSELVIPICKTANDTDMQKICQTKLALLSQGGRA